MCWGSCLSLLQDSLLLSYGALLHAASCLRWGKTNIVCVTLKTFHRLSRLQHGPGIFNWVLPDVGVRERERKKGGGGLQKGGRKK